PSVSLAKRASSPQRSGGTDTVRRGPSPSAATPKRSCILARAWSWITRSVDLGGGRGAPARLVEVRDLVLQQEQPVQQRLRRGRAARDVDVHRDHPVHTLDHVVAVAEGTARVGARA